MIEYIYWAIGLILLLPFTWVLYVAIMGFKRNLDNMGKVSKFIAYCILPFGLLADVLFNFTWGSVMFLEPPRELLMTTRLKRHLSDYDPSGKHC